MQFETRFWSSYISGIDLSPIVHLVFRSVTFQINLEKITESQMGRLHRIHTFPPVTKPKKNLLGSDFHPKFPHYTTLMDHLRVLTINFAIKS